MMRQTYLADTEQKGGRREGGKKGGMKGGRKTERIKEISNVWG